MKKTFNANFCNENEFCWYVVIYEKSNASLVLVTDESERFTEINNR